MVVGQKKKMFKITLLNFRKFDKAEFIINKKMTLINGQSGSGKTTIFMAIVFVLTGEGRKLITYGKKNCSVMFEYKQLVITRRKSPNSLVVMFDGKRFEEKEAQSVIDANFPNWQMGYISQQPFKTFLFLTPLEKLRFIEELAFVDEDVEKLKELVKTLTQKRKEKLSSAQQQEAAMEIILKEQSISKPETTPQKTEEEYQLEINLAEKKLKRLTETFYETKVLNETKLQLEKELLSLQSETPLDVKQIEVEITRLTEEHQKWKMYEQENQKLVSMQFSEHSDEELTKRDSDFQTMLDLQKEIKNLYFAIRNKDFVKKNLESSIFPLTCPNCQTDLTIYKSELVAFSKQENKTVRTLEEIKEFEKKAAEVDAVESKIRVKEKNLEQLKVLYPGLNITDVLLKQNKAMISLNKTYHNQVNLCAVLRVEKPKTEDNRNFLEQQKRTLILRQVKEKQFNAIKFTDLNSIQDSLDLIRLELETLKSEKQTSIAHRQWLRKETKQAEVKKLDEEYTRSIKLQSLIKEAERISVEKIISQINHRSQIYLDHFFDNLTAKITSDSGKLNLVITQNGFNSDLQSLSGGEVSRLILAFTIAIAEIRNIGFLLLDECVASLDEDTTTEVINVIKTHYDGYIVCIAHQTTEGVFDEVIQLS